MMKWLITGWGMMYPMFSASSLLRLWKAMPMHRPAALNAGPPLLPLFICTQHNSGKGHHLVMIRNTAATATCTAMYPSSLQTNSNTVLKPTTLNTGPPLLPLLICGQPRAVAAVAAATAAATSDVRGWQASAQLTNRPRPPP